MSEQDRLANRIPAEKLQQVESWVVPQVHAKGEPIPSAQLEQKQQSAAQQDAAPPEEESIENLDSQQELKPLTAEDLSRISEEARREGYEEGYREGCDKGEKDGYDKGFKSGEAKAFQQTLAKRNQELKRLTNIADTLFQPMQDQQVQLENILVEWAVSLAQGLLLQEIQHRPETLYRIVERALSALPAGSDNVCIHLNPEDAELIAELAADNQWQIRKDPGISAGGCRVSSAVSLVDFTLEPRIESYLNEVRMGGDIDAETLPEVPVMRDRASEAEPLLAADDRSDVLPEAAAPQQQSSITQQVSSPEDDKNPQVSGCALKAADADKSLVEEQSPAVRETDGASTTTTRGSIPQ